MTYLRAAGLVGIAPLAGALLWVAGSAIVPMLTRMALALGVGWVTFTGFNVLFDQLESYVYNSFSGLPSDVLDLLAIARLDDAASVVLSAISIKVVWKFLCGHFKAFRWHNPADC